MPELTKINRDYIERRFADDPETKANWLKDLSDHWKCILCAWEVKLNEPLVIGFICCGGCGMTTLRPIHDFKEKHT